ncbi:homocysteine S-methyltransferase [Rhypophila decipiens]|uniref:Homocysteine S-methyltransferase n=1 Tax=Rhypophila decipiens TaxID=261697 RepID=A0AAN6Y8U5_9PEZI|nr:homocysteine S-methyltransferase [Rhypophila decipiens]
MDDAVTPGSAMTNKAAPVPILFLDGGLGTSLEDKYHITFSTDTPLWSSHLLLSQSESDGLPILRKCQADFALAGADIILTATYQASLEAFRASGVTCRQEVVSKYVSEAVKSAADAASITADRRNVENKDGTTEKVPGVRRGGVALAIGPYGATMIPSAEYSGKYDEQHDQVETLTEWHWERFNALFAPLEDELLDRLDYIAFETVPRVDEILAVRRVMDRVKMALPNSRLANLPVWISCLYPGEGNTLPDGSSVDEVFEALLGNTGAAEGIRTMPWGIGINCTKVAKLPSLVKQYEEAVRGRVESGDLSDWPSLVVYPDGTNGEVYNTETKKWEVPDGADVPKTPWETQLAAVVRSADGTGQWRSILVGGCCKTTDRDIKELRATVLERSSC